jgi:hypothetical protein
MMVMLMIYPIMPIMPRLAYALSAQEHWHTQKAQQGDHIRVSRGVYNHHGIYISDSEVIHFSSHDDDNLLGEGNEVIATSLRQFLRSGTLEVKIYTSDEQKDLYPVANIVRWAKDSLGDSGYHLAFNNCEHFANWCTLGRFHSQQVNNVLGATKMGFFSSVASFVGGLFSGGGRSSGGGSRSSESSNTSYEPDKVRVAEIERDKVLQLADRENERIGLMKEAQMELVEFNARMEAAVIEAKARGFHAVQQSLITMTKELNILAEERMVLIENGNLDILQRVESMYGDLENSINTNDFMHNKLPALLQLQNQYPEGSDLRQSYGQAVSMQINHEFQFVTTQMQQLGERRKAVVHSVLATKDKIHDHINHMVTARIAHLEKSQATALPAPTSHHQPAIGQTATPIGIGQK